MAEPKIFSGLSSRLADSRITRRYVRHTRSSRARRDRKHDFSFKDVKEAPEAMNDRPELSTIVSKDFQESSFARVAANRRYDRSSELSFNGISQLSSFIHGYLKSRKENGSSAKFSFAGKLVSRVARRGNPYGGKTRGRSVRSQKTWGNEARDMKGKER